MSEETKWMKWQHTFAWGTPKGWEWVEVIDDPECIDETLSELADRYESSDKYRGIEYHLFDAPDPEWLEKHIEGLKEQRRSLERRTERLSLLLGSLQEEKTA